MATVWRWGNGRKEEEEVENGRKQEMANPKEGEAFFTDPDEDAEDAQLRRCRCCCRQFFEAISLSRTMKRGFF